MGAGAWLLAASLSIALGIWPDLGSLMVAVFVVPVYVTVGSAHIPEL